MRILPPAICYLLSASGLTVAFFAIPSYLSAQQISVPDVQKSTQQNQAKLFEEFDLVPGIVLPSQSIDIGNSSVEGVVDANT